MTKRVDDSGITPYEGSGSIIGRQSFNQTTVFLRIGGGMMDPLYAKLRISPNRQTLSPKESTSLIWGEAAIDHAKPRIETPKPNLTDRAAYTDAEGKSQIIDALIIGPSTLKKDKAVTRVCVLRVRVADWLKHSRAPSTSTAWK